MVVEDSGGNLQSTVISWFIGNAIYTMILIMKYPHQCIRILMQTLYKQTSFQIKVNADHLFM